MKSAFHSIPVRFVINLASRPDRMESFRAMAKDLPFDVERFEAIGPESFSPAAGNLCSIAMVVQKGILAGADRMAIFEDDAAMTRECINQPELLATVEGELDLLDRKWPSWSIYMLGVGACRPREVYVESNRTVRVKRAGGTHAFILSRSGMSDIYALGIKTVSDAQQLINSTGKMPDVYLTSVFPTFLHVPILFNQRSGYSDIAQRRTSPAAGLEKYEAETLTPAVHGA